jgi:hypothetical protein
MTATRHAAVWTGVFAPPLGWALHLLVGYWLEEAACSTASRRFFAGDHAAQIGVTVGALALVVVGLAASAWTLFAARRGRVPDPRGRIAFLGVAGVTAGIFFLALTALAGTYAIVLDPCTAS